MRKLIAAAILAATALTGAVTGCALHGHAARGCTFDGGGYIVSGDAARTSDGHVWGCADGQLYRLS